ncbi:MAG TPA: VWA domain-containing protein [Gemmataceae bacterium]|jgi:hypothetical protein|nr:VWA domain-containing protein [Gemmataceae bacterium]
MRVHHRIPTIFNLSMVDVLCCALGCVILLWLLNLRDARERSLAVDATSGKLQDVRTALDQAGGQLRALTGERDAEKERVERLRRESRNLMRDLAQAQQETDALSKQLQTQTQRTRSATERLTTLTRAQQSLSAEKRNADERIESLGNLLLEKTVETRTAVRRADDLTAKLSDAQARNKKLQNEAELLRAQLTVAEGAAQSMAAKSAGEKSDLSESNRQVERLQKENSALAVQVGRVRAAAENRFEGIELTGRRVLFLVDMSGSMELVDEKTPDPKKWTGVRDAMVKIMRSLPDLQRFQVLLFSDQLQYLMGSNGAWLEYDAQKSADGAYRAINLVKPKGSTNMHAAMEEAFRFRGMGLDTIYLLSDGLPNDGPGLTAEQANSLKETDREVVLARYLRNEMRRTWNREIPGQPKVRINTVGFFYESPDVGAFLWALARENDGGFVGMSKH